MKEDYDVRIQIHDDTSLFYCCNHIIFLRSKWEAKLVWKNEADEQLPHNVKRYFSMIKKSQHKKQTKHARTMLRVGGLHNRRLWQYEIEWLLMRSVCRNSGLRSDFHFLDLQSALINIVSNSNEAQSNETESHRRFFLLLSVSVCHLVACFTAVMLHFSAFCATAARFVQECKQNSTQFDLMLLSELESQQKSMKRMNMSLKPQTEILQTLLEAGPAADVFNLSFSTSPRCLRLRCQSEWRAAARRLQLAAALLSVHILREVARLEAALSPNAD